jgi:polygalacturonase
MKTFYVIDFIKGCKSDDEAIKKCMAEAAKAPARTVIFSGKDWRVGEAVLLPSNTTVIIDGCTVKQNDEVYDNVFRGDNLVLDSADPFGMPLDCRKTENIKILGKNGAKICGPDKNRTGFHPVIGEYQEMVGDFWGWRTLTVSLSNCDNFEIGGITFEKGRCWTLSFDLCSNGYIHDLQIFTDVKNGDGIDLRSGCRNCVIENIYGKTSDDTVACTALYSEGVTYPQKNYLYPLEPGRCVKGDGDRKNIHDITIRNIKSGGRHHGVICLAANGCQVYSVTIENIEEDPFGDENPWRDATVRIYTGYGSGFKKGDIRDITVSNVTGRYANRTFYSNIEAENITLRNITHQKNPPIVLDNPEGFKIIR